MQLEQGHVARRQLFKLLLTDALRAERQLPGIAHGGTAARPSLFRQICPLLVTAIPGGVFLGEQAQAHAKRGALARVPPFRQQYAKAVALQKGCSFAQEAMRFSRRQDGPFRPRRAQAAFNWGKKPTGRAEPCQQPLLRPVHAAFPITQDAVVGSPNLSGGNNQARVVACLQRKMQRPLAALGAGCLRLLAHCPRIAGRLSSDLRFD